MNQSGKSKEYPVDLVSVVQLTLATAWVGAMVMFALRDKDLLWLVTILGAICMGAGAVYFSLASMTRAQGNEPDRQGASSSGSENGQIRHSADKSALESPSAASLKRLSPSDDHLHRLFRTARNPQGKV